MKNVDIIIAYFIKAKEVMDNPERHVEAEAFWDALSLEGLKEIHGVALAFEEVIEDAIQKREQVST